MLNQSEVNQNGSAPRSRVVYMDHSATTPADQVVIQEMLPFLTEKFGNPSSVHLPGQQARAAIDRARRQVADLLGARPSEITFLSGGTEANNLALKGAAQILVPQGRHLITSSIEHSSTQGVCNYLEQSGWQVTRLPVYGDGRVRVDAFRQAMKSDTVLVCIMLANNEIGTIQPISEVAQIIKEARERDGRRILFHTDAVQAFGRIPVSVGELGCDMLSISGHKLYAPKGIGALYVRKGVQLAPQIIGGHQEHRRRAGTEPVPLIVALGAAASLAQRETPAWASHMGSLRDKFEHGVKERIPDIVFNGAEGARLPHLSNISFRYIDGESLLINLDMQGIAVSTGSACSSGSLEVSPVIRALGRDEELARGSLRFSLGKDNSEEDVEYVLEALTRAVDKLRRISPLAPFAQERL